MPAHSTRGAGARYYIRESETAIGKHFRDEKSVRNERKEMDLLQEC